MLLTSRKEQMFLTQISSLTTPSGQGDYKVLKNNKTIPNDGISGYVFTADTYLDKVSKGEITGINLEDYLSEELLVEANHPDSFPFGKPR